MRTVKKKVPATTNNITKGIINFLLEKGHSASRVNTTGVWDEQKQAFRRTGARKGFYDINATLKTKYSAKVLFDPEMGTYVDRSIGLTLAIDTKRGRDKLGDDQIKFRDEILAAGGLTFESKNYNDFVLYYYDFIEPNYIK